MVESPDATFDEIVVCFDFFYLLVEFCIFMVGNQVKNEHDTVKDVSIQLKTFERKIEQVLFQKVSTASLIKFRNRLIKAIPSDYLPQF